ncbi:MAG: hypothetical protein WCT52_03815 [Candidatus Micrarchaeia archaeon]|jgi:hypothetical protein
MQQALSQKGTAGTAIAGAPKASCASCPLLATCNKAKDRMEKAEKEAFEPVLLPPIRKAFQPEENASAAAQKNEPAAAPFIFNISQYSGESAVIRTAYYQEEERRTKERAKLKEQGTRLSADEKRRLEALEEEILKKQIALEALKTRNLENALSSLDPSPSVSWLKCQCFRWE